MDIEPSFLVFREVRLNQTYTASVCISNSFQTPVEFQLIPSHQRYSLSPNRITLYPKQSIVITVKLNANQKKIDYIEDYVKIKSEYTEQRIPIEIHFKEDNNVNQMLLDKQRQEFEVKSEKVLKILSLKDEEIATLRSQLEDQNSHNRKLQNDIEMYKQQISSIEYTKNYTTTSSTNNFSTDNELRGLREQCSDQTEQINVLLSEVSKLREEKNNFSSKEQLSLRSAKAEIKMLQSEVEGLQQKLKQQQKVSFDNSLATSKQTQYEPLVEGGISTSTPVDFQHTDRVHLLVQQKVSDIKSQFDRDLIVIRDQLADSRKEEQTLRDRLQEANRLADIADRDSKVSAERLERMRSEADQTSVVVQDLQMQLKAVKDEQLLLSSHPSADAHTWWSYVWHETQKNRKKGKGRSQGKMQRQSSLLEEEEEAKGGGISLLDLRDEDGDDDEVGENLRSALRQQAIEITNIRQELLKDKLVKRKELSDLKDQLSSANREVVRLKALTRLHKGDKDVKIAEMAVTIRSLSAKSDLHSQLSAVRQDILSEKLVSHHLRSDLESYRSMLEEEQIKTTLCRKEIASLQNTIDCNDIYQSVVNVPGVDPHTLLSSMSGFFTHINLELSNTKQSLEDAFTRLNSLQNSQRKSVSYSNTSSDGLRMSRSQRSLSPGLRRDTNININDLKEADHEAQREEKESWNLSPHSTWKERGEFAMSMSSSAMLIDKETTPKMVLESLDVVLLNDKLKLQDSVIYDLNIRIDILMEENMKLQKEKLHNNKKNDTSEKNELEFSSRKQILIQTELDETREELKKLRLSYCDLEKQMIDYKSAIRGFKELNNLNVQDELLPEAVSEDAYRELEHTKNLLRERTVQLKVLMETLDSLQFAGVVPNESDSMLDNADNNLFSLANNPLSIPRAESSWSTQALVKRVIELTTDLCSQNSIVSMREQKLLDYESEITRKIKENNRLKLQLKSHQNNTLDLKAQCEVYKSQIIDNERAFIEQLNSLKQANDTIISELRITESENLKFVVELEELKKQIEVFVQEEAIRYLDHIHIDGEKIIESMQRIKYLNDDNVDINENIRKLITNLSKEWKEVSLTNINPTHSNNISKQKQIFLQKFSDLMSKLSDKESRAHQKCQELEFNLRKSEIGKKVAEEKLVLITEEMIAHKKRNIYYERVITTDYLSLLNKKGKVELLLKKHLVEGRERYYSLLNSVLKEKRENKTVECKKESESLLIKRLQSQLLEYESRGSYDLQYRDEAINSLNVKISSVEESMYKWFRTELPRLMNGLPVTEDNLANYNYNDDFVSEFGLGFASIGIDKTYALTQALCSAKAVQTTQELKIEGLTERLSIYKEKCIELDGVIQSYSDELKGDIFKRSISLEHNNNITVDVDGKFTEHNQLLSNQILELEEEAVEYKGKIEYMDIRYNEMKRIVDVLLSDENTIKTKATNQLTKIRVDLENKHIEELKSMREMFEKEKIYLIDELEKVNLAVLEIDDTEQKLEKPKKVTVHDPIFDDNDTLNKSIDNILNAVTSSEHKNQSYLNIDKRIDQIINDKNKNYASNKSDSASSVDPSNYDAAHSFVSKDFFSMENSSSKEQSNSKDATTTIVQPVIHDIASLPMSGSEEKSSDDRNYPSDPSTGKSSITTRNDDNNKKDNNVKNNESPNVFTYLGALDNTNDDSLSQPDVSNSNTLRNSDVNNLLRDVDMDSLERQLSIEKRKYEEARNEIKELEQLLSIHQEAFKQYLEKEKTDQLSVAGKSAETQYSTEDVFVASSSNHHTEAIVQNEFSKEDKFLWPSINSLADELLKVLNSLSDRYDKSIVQTAIAMTSRLKILCESISSEKTKENILDNPYILDTSNEVYQNTENSTVSHSLRHLVSRMKIIENTIVENSSDKAVSDRNLFLLRDLRKKVLDLENVLADQLMTERSEWEAERNNLIQIANDNMDMVMQFRQEQDDSVTLIKERYEEALKKSNEALEINTKAAKSEIQRLEEIVRQYATQIAQLRTNIADSQHIVIDTKNESKDTSSSSNYPSNNNLDEFLKMQKLLDKTNDELLRCRQQTVYLEEAHQREVSDLRSHFNRYKQIQTEVISSLEDQTNEPSEEFEKEMFPVASIQDAENKIRILGYKYKSKSVELDAAMRALYKYNEQDSHFSEVTSEYLQTQGDSDSISFEYPDVTVNPLYPPIYGTYTSKQNTYDHTTTTLNSTNQDANVDIQKAMDRIPNIKTIIRSSPSQYSDSYKEIKTNMVEARAAAAEKEIELLSKSLSREKTISMALRSQLKETLERSGEALRQQQFSSSEYYSTNNIDNKGKSSGNIDSVNVVQEFLEKYMTDFSIDDFKDSGDYRNQLTKAIKVSNELRRAARSHLSKYRDLLIQNADAKLPVKDTDQINKMKSDISHLKEDVSRKITLINSLKAAKVAESKALEQWKSEYAKVEENAKRLHRSVDSKDNMIRDLKAKLVIFEYKESQEKERAVAPVISGGPTSDVNNLSVVELKGRLKGSELERGRMKTRLQALKERVLELEGLQTTLTEENERLKRNQDRTEALKTTITRKEEIIKSMKSQLDKTQSDLEELQKKESIVQSENDKKIRNLQRHLEISQRSQEELERESELMRKRLMTEHSEPITIVNRINKSIQPPPPPFDYQISKMKTTTSSSVKNESNRIGDDMILPSSLGVDAVKDIKDVINSLGVDRSELSAALSLSPSSEDNNDDDDDDSDESEEGRYHRNTETSSVERRLQALVNAAIQTPTRRKV